MRAQRARKGLVIIQGRSQEKMNIPGPSLNASPVQRKRRQGLLTMGPSSAPKDSLFFLRPPGPYLAVGTWHDRVRMS